MASITSSVGTFTGLNYADIIDKLMEVEKQPYNKLLERKDAYENEVSSYAELSSSLGSLRTALEGIQPDKVTSFKATSTDETILKATAGTKASAGEYEVKVEQLAQQLRATSKGFQSDSVVFKTGSLSITAGSKTTSVKIDASNNTLVGIRDAINRSSAGVVATVINDGKYVSDSEFGSASSSSGYKLVVSPAAGTTGNIAINGSDGGPTGESLGAFTFNYDSEFNEFTGNMQVLQSPQKALLNINGISIESETNVIDKAIVGVTLDLQKASPGTVVRVSVTEDDVASSESMTKFIEAYNGVMDKIKELKKDGAPLEHDRTLTAIQTRMRSVTTLGFGGSYLTNYGISHDKDGKMVIESDKMNNAIEKDSSSFYKMLEALTNNFPGSFESELKRTMREVIASRNNELSVKINRAEDSQIKMEHNLEDKRTAYVKKFARLESTVADLQANSSNALSQLSSLTGGN